MKMRENYKDLNIRPPKNIDKKIFKGSDPKSHVTLIFNDTMTYNRSNAYYLRSLEDYLDIRLYEILREELSGVYGVGVTCSLNRIPYQNYNVIFRIPCAPNNVDSLVNQSLKIIEDIKMNGISDDYLKKIKETQLREHEINIKTNNYWLNYLENTSLFNDDISRIDKFTEEIEKLSSNDIKNIANRVFDHNKIQVTLFPEKK